MNHKLCGIAAHLMATISPFFLYGCGSGGSGMPNASKVVWRTDAETLRRKFTVLDSIVSCSWTAGVIKVQDLGLPSPPTGYMKGYAILSSDGETKFKSAYTWQEVDRPTVDKLEMPPGCPKLTGSALLSNDLIKSLPTKSTYHRGAVYYFPAVNVVYFELFSN